jgi:signal transduction histidine kinase
VTVYAPDGSPRAIRWLMREPNAEGAATSDQRVALAGEGPGRRLSFLANIGGLLARSFDFERTLNMLAIASVPLLGDWCFVDVIDEDARVHRLATARAPGGDAQLHVELAARAPELTRVENLITRTFHSGRPELAREEAATLAEMLAADDGQRAALSRLEPRSAISVPLDARGSVLGVLTFVMAHSGRRHTLADLHLATELATRAALLADHARLYRAAQQASQAKSDFLAAMSHELRTPLTAIVGYTDLLIDEIIGPVSPEQKEKLARIRGSSNHLLVLIDEILTFARLEAGRDEVHPAPVMLHEIVDQAVSIIGPQVAVRGLAMRVELPPAPVSLHTDPGRLRQILVNLLANAAKFTSRGEVGIRAAVDDGWATFEVWDTGIGIAREHLDVIFSPFWQVEQRATRQYGGTGLGLSVVRRLAQLLGGTVDVASELGAGSRFTVRIPRELPDAPAPHAPLSEAPPPQPRRDRDPAGPP